MFIVGESEVGVESLKFIQDSYFYQIYSILIKSDLPISVWRDLYKKYIHPSGWELFSEVSLETLVTTLRLPANMPIAIPDASANVLVVVDEAAAPVIAIGSRANVTVIDSDSDQCMCHLLKIL